MEPRASASIRRFLLAVLIFGMLAMILDLVLLGHIDGVLQWAPLFVLVVGLITLVWHAARPAVATVRSVQVMMTLCVVNGIAGVLLHYRGNHEFELEMYPSMGGIELILKTLTGATPVLAPGSMILLGLIGFGHTLNHPLVNRDLINQGNKI